MKIVIIGGTGLIGSKTVAILRQSGHEIVAASPKSGVNTITGEGVKQAVSGAQVVIDLANSPSFEDKAVLDFFQTAGPQPAPGGGRRRRPPPCRAVHRRNRSIARQRLFPRQGGPGEADRGVGRALHHHPLDAVHGVPQGHRRWRHARKQGQDVARPVPAHRGGRRCRLRRRGGAGRAAQRHRRDRRPRPGAVQRNRRPLSEGGGRPARGRARRRGPLLRQPGRGALAGAAGRGAARPHRSRRMAPALAGRRLIGLRRPRAGSMTRIICSLLAAILPFGSAVAQAPTAAKNAKVTLVYQHEMPNVPGKSIKGVLVEYGPGGFSPGHTHPKSAFIYATVLEGAIRSQVNDGPVTTYKAGQSFSELPGDRHAVSANASDTEPAKLLAAFVLGTNETQLVFPLEK